MDTIGWKFLGKRVILNVGLTGINGESFGDSQLFATVGPFGMPK